MSDPGPGSRRQIVSAVLWTLGAAAFTVMVLSSRSRPWYLWPAMVLLDLVALVTLANALFGRVFRPRG